MDGLYPQGTVRLVGPAGAGVPVVIVSDASGQMNSQRASRRGLTLTTYGVPRTLQERSAGLRTDLDSFSDSEGVRELFAALPAN